MSQLEKKMLQFLNLFNTHIWSIVIQKFIKIVSLSLLALVEVEISLCVLPFQSKPLTRIPFTFPFDPWKHGKIIHCKLSHQKYAMLSLWSQKCLPIDSSGPALGLRVEFARRKHFKVSAYADTLQYQDPYIESTITETFVLHHLPKNSGPPPFRPIP